MPQGTENGSATSLNLATMRTVHVVRSIRSLEAVQTHLCMTAAAAAELRQIKRRRNRKRRWHVSASRMKTLSPILTVSPIAAAKTSA